MCVVRIWRHGVALWRERMTVLYRSTRSPWRTPFKGDMKPTDGSMACDPGVDFKNIANLVHGHGSGHGPAARFSASQFGLRISMLFAPGREGAR